MRKVDFLVFLGMVAALALPDDAEACHRRHRRSCVTAACVPSCSSETAVLSNPDVTVTFSNVHTEGDKICADIHVHAEASALGQTWKWDKDFPHQCVNARVTIFDEDVGVAHVKVTVYPNNNKFCADIEVKVFGYNKTFTKCSG